MDTNEHYIYYAQMIRKLTLNKECRLSIFSLILIRNYFLIPKIILLTHGAKSTLDPDL